MSEEQLGPVNHTIPEQHLTICSGCKFYQRRLLRSGSDALYAEICSHSEAPVWSIYGMSGNLEKSSNGYVETPDWCPFLIEANFIRLKDLWRSETNFQSNPTIIHANPHYRQILKMGNSVKDLIIADMIKNRTDWFDALHQLFLYNPIKREHAGMFDEMIADWEEYLTSFYQNFKKYH